MHLDFRLVDVEYKSSLLLYAGIKGSSDTFIITGNRINKKGLIKEKKNS